MAHFRLVGALQNISALKLALAKDDVMFGTVETWILHKLTAGRLHLTDISNAAATGEHLLILNVEIVEGKKIYAFVRYVDRDLGKMDYGL